ncbi:uncharacterized protein VP01_6371g1, partial [Puccinia sorghi]
MPYSSNIPFKFAKVTSNLPLRITSAKPKPALMPPLANRTKTPLPLKQPLPSLPPVAQTPCLLLARYYSIRLCILKKFPTKSSKVYFAISFMKDNAGTWSKPYLMNVFNAEEVAFDKFLDDFRCSFFDHNCQHRAEVALQSLRQTGTVLYKHEIAVNVQLAVVMSNIKFTSLQTMQAMGLKAGQKIEGIQSGQPTPISPASSSAPTTNPNAMDLSAFQCGGPHNRLSDAKHNHQLQLKLCFCCGQAGHFSCGCSNKNRKSQ